MTTLTLSVLCRNSCVNDALFSRAGECSRERRQVGQLIGYPGTEPTCCQLSAFAAELGLLSYECSGTSAWDMYKEQLCTHWKVAGKYLRDNKPVGQVSVQCMSPQQPLFRYVQALNTAFNTRSTLSTYTTAYDEHHRGGTTCARIRTSRGATMVDSPVSRGLVGYTSFRLSESQMLGLVSAALSAPLDMGPMVGVLFGFRVPH
eukprot:4240804-Pyramimonas_sp.AAC.1